MSLFAIIKIKINPTHPTPVESDVSMDGEFELLRGLQCGVSVLQARQTDAVRYATLRYVVHMYCHWNILCMLRSNSIFSLLLSASLLSSPPFSSLLSSLSSFSFLSFFLLVSSLHSSPFSSPLLSFLRLTSSLLSLPHSPAHRLFSPPLTSPHISSSFFALLLSFDFTFPTFSLVPPISPHLSSLLFSFPLSPKLIASLHLTSPLLSTPLFALLILSDLPIPTYYLDLSPIPSPHLTSFLICLLPHLPSSHLSFLPSLVSPYSSIRSTLRCQYV